jgi:nitrogen fixation protein FixH
MSRRFSDLDKQTLTHGRVTGTPVSSSDMTNKSYVDKKRTIELCLNGSTALTTDDEVYARIPSHMAGARLVEVAACCKTPGSTSGDVTLTLSLNGTSMLTTDITIDEGETDSSTAATPAVIDSTNRIVAEGDQLVAACSGAGADVLFCVVQATFGV